MKIEDQELCELFRVESEEHLQSLDRGLLLLEESQMDPSLLEGLFRGAHSLKGAAKMLGLTEIAAITHHFEDELGAAKRGKRGLTRESIDRLCGALDSIRKLVREAVTGEPSGVDLEGVLSDLGAQDEERKGLQEGQKLLPVGGAPHDALEPPPADSPTPQTETITPGAGHFSSVEKASPYQISTIRVETQRLDTLMAQTGELAVTRRRIDRLVEKIDALLSLWEESRSDAGSRRFSGGESEAVPAPGDVGGLLRFYERERDRLERFGAMLGDLRNAAAEGHARLNTLTDELGEGVQTLRLLPLSTLFDLFPRMVRDQSKQHSKEIRLVIEGGETRVDKRFIEDLKDPLMHLLRNAIDHGVEAGEVREASGKPRVALLRLSARRTPAGIEVEVADDGQGIDLEGIKRIALKQRIAREDELATMTPEQVQALIFVPGFSTMEIVTDVSGRGVGLDVVRNNIENLKGTIRVASTPGAGTTFHLLLPLTLATARIFLVSAGGQTFALPVEHVETSIRAMRCDLFTLGSHQAITVDGRPLSVAPLSELLELKAGSPPSSAGPRASGTGETPLYCVVLSLVEERFGLLVEELLNVQEVVLKPMGGLLRRVRNVSEVTLLDTGEICIVLNPHDLLKTLKKRQAPAKAEEPAIPSDRKPVILLAEDSITTRTQEKRILESAGYEVVTAVDGMDALQKLHAGSFDALVSDVEMPNMDGLALAERIRREGKYRDLPIILVTSLATDEDRKRGLQVGASAYIAKPAFDQRLFLETVRRLT